MVFGKVNVVECRLTDALGRDWRYLVTFSSLGTSPESNSNSNTIKNHLINRLAELMIEKSAARAIARPWRQKDRL